MEIRNAEFCADADSWGAYCFNSFTNDERQIPKAEWDIERVGMVCTKVESFSNWKEAILKLCEKTKKCSYVFVKEVELMEAIK